jgi:hypothetical protein
MEHGSGSGSGSAFCITVQWAGVKLEGQTPEWTGRAGKARSQAARPALNR